MSKYSALRKQPLLRILLIFISGIILTDKYYKFFIAYIHYIILFVLFLLILLFVLIYFKRGIKLHDFLIFISVFFISILVTTIVFLPVNNSEKNKRVYSGVVYENPGFKTNSILIPVKLHKKTFQNLAAPTKVNIYTVRDSSILKKIHVGDQVLFIGSLTRIKNFGNPGEFNYEKYMASRAIFFQAWVTGGQIVKSECPAKLSLVRFAETIRQKVYMLLREHIKNQEALALTTAMTIGDRDLISDEVMQSYAITGVLHILSVSGLHVGIIFLFLNFILKTLDNSAKLRIIKAIIIILLVWFYALISGLSPSVNRASLMFSLISFGQLFRRNISFFNILAAAALIMLLINPLQLYDVGFQLSFLAIGGIAYFQPFLYNLFTFRHFIVDAIYKMLTVSIAAQLATFPLSIYYFNQFPVYFWLANMLVIPLVFVLLIVAILLISFSFIPVVANLFGLIGSFLGLLLNNWVELIENIPGSSIQNISITTVEVWFIYTLILLVFIWISQHYIKAMILAIVPIILLLLFNTGIGLISKNSEILTIYNTRIGLSFGIYSDTDKKLYTTISDSSSLEQIKHIAVNHLSGRKLKPNIKIIQIDSAISFNYIKNPKTKAADFFIKVNGDTLFYVLRDKKSNALSDNNLTCNYLLVAAEILPPEKMLNVKEVVISCTIKFFTINKWKDYALKNNMKLHVIKYDGAFEVDINLLN